MHLLICYLVKFHEGLNIYDNEIDTSKKCVKNDSYANFYISYNVHFIGRQFKENSSSDQEPTGLYRGIFNSFLPNVPL